MEEPTVVKYFVLKINILHKYDYNMYFYESQQIYSNNNITYVNQNQNGKHYEEKLYTITSKIK